MSDRLRDPPEELDDELDAEDEDEPDEDELESVEYFVDAPEELCCFTSVPNSVHSSQTSSSAPSIFTVFGEFVSVPHISH